MSKNYVFALCVCLFSLSIQAQNNNIARVLAAVEQNNNELKALASMLESQKLELKSSNNLSNPQLEALFLPFGNHSSSDYSEFQISQSFEFPSVYVSRKNLIEKQQKDLDLAYLAKKQEVLLDAKKLCLEFMMLNKSLAIEQSRLEQSKKVFEQIKTLFEKEQVGILALNKANIAWLQEQFGVREIELKRQSLLEKLKMINGGSAIAINAIELVDNQELLGIDNIWSEKLRTDPSLISMQQKEGIALQKIKLSKNQSLPNINAGFNQQGFAGEYYSGIYGGITIPLFGNKNKVKAAKANFQFQHSYSIVHALKAKVAFKNQYNAYTLLLEKYNEYNQTLKGLNSEALLLKAYQLGEISFIEYYIELQFYQQAFDTMLDMEKHVNLQLAELLKHQL
jgi:cobalt-zinc-cadmium efflux system outer membrane protein